MKPLKDLPRRALAAGLAIILSAGLSACSRNPISQTPAEQELTENGEKSNEVPEYEGYLFYVTAAGDKAVTDKQKIALMVGLSPEEALTELPEPLSVYEAESCALPGMDVIYTYSGYELTVYKETDTGNETSSVLTNIRLTDDSHTTAEGIYIGSTVTELLAAYGECIPISGEYFYQKGEMELSFLTRNQVVTSIEYRNR